MSVNIDLKDETYSGINKIDVPLAGGGTQIFSIGGGTPTLQTKSETYTPSGSQQTDTITPDNGYDGLDQVNVTVNAVPSGVFDTMEVAAENDMSISVSSGGLITAEVNGTVSAHPVYTAGYFDTSDTMSVVLSGTKTSQLPTQAATTITPTTSQQTAVTSGKYTTGAVTVDPIPSQYIIPSGTTTLTSNTMSGSGYLVKNYERAIVNVCIQFEVDNNNLVTCNRTWQGCYDAITDDAYDAIAKYNSVTYGASAYGLDTNTGELHFVVFQNPSNGTCTPLFDIYYPYSGNPYVVTPSHIGPNLQTKTRTYTPSSYQQEEIISADNGYDGLLAVAVTVERVAGLTLPVGPSLSYTGTRKAKIYQSNSTQYWNIGVGYHNSAEYYEVPPLLVDTKNITQNGTYNAIDDDLDGYSSVTVNVSPTLVNYAIRPDATLVQKYTYDKYMHADENITIPSYSTSAQTIKAGATIGTITLDRDNYFYYVVERMLTIPTYSITTKGKGRCEYHMGVHVYEVIDIPGSTIHALVDTSKYYTTRLNAVSTASASYREVYYSGSSTLTTVSTQAYGTCQAAMAPSISSGVLTINSPTVTERGSTSYFTSTYANAVTDIRAQYVIEVYKAPKNNLNIEGWSHQQSIQQIIDCANSANHKLT